MTLFSSKSLIRESIEPVCRLCTLAHLPDMEVTHDMRVAVKRTLAILQLIDLYPGTPLKDIKIVKDLKLLSQYFAQTRDQAVLLLLLEELINKSNSAQVTRLLMVSHELIATNLSSQNLKTSIIEKLATAVLEDSQQLINKQVSEMHIRAYINKHFLKACHQGSEVLVLTEVEKLHKWRKKVKNLCYQNEVLGKYDVRSILPEKKLHKLGGKLGEMHDISNLKMLLEQQQCSMPNTTGVDPPAWDLVYELLEKQRSKLLDECRGLFGQVCSAN